ncbi:hypothetical protein IU487_32800 [Nocardia puris]|uniref:hypothetical protein n=1 Tax=Nocardia puris TaxID=208602 RepID=UPI001893EDF5|nr:hypothetical protein [Nocardia puris]MBF6215779.1 hypothetical protein [Nocardia puris]
MGKDSETAQLASSLTSWLADVRVTGLSAREATALITEQTVRWAHANGWTVDLEREALIARRTGRRMYHGHLDVFCWRDDHLPCIAIEIDRSNKRWSVEKLLAEADTGNIALWVRWYGTTRIVLPNTVGLVDISATAAFERPRREPRRRERRAPRI